MRDPWSPEDGDELDELLAQGREAWRGEVHVPDESWRRDSLPEAWRGEEHLADWPEHAAGPEYWMFKEVAEDL